MSNISLALAGKLSTKTGTQIITDARRVLNEPSPSFWTEDDMLLWYNQGRAAIASRTMCLGKTFTITLAAGTREYNIPTDADALTIIAAIYEGDGSGLLRGSPRRVGHAVNVSKPTNWYAWGGKVGVYPTPVTGEDCIGKAVTFFYTEILDDAALSAVTGLPALYDNALTHYVAAFANYKDKLWGRGDTFFKLFEVDCERYRLDIADRGEDSEGEVVK